MKINYGDKLVIYLNNNYLKQKNIDQNNIEDCLYNIFDILKENYNLKLLGLYNVTIYSDLNYGLVIELEHENFDINYYNELDMQIKVISTSFLIKIEDLEPFIKTKIYEYKHNYYTSDLKKIEFGDLVYDTNEIFKHAKQVEI